MDLRAFTKEWRPERWLVQEAFIAFRQRNNSFVKSWQDKGIWVKCSKWWMITRKIRVSLTKFVGVDFFPPNVFLLPVFDKLPEWVRLIAYFSFNQTSAAKISCTSKFPINNPLFLSYLGIYVYARSLRHVWLCDPMEWGLSGTPVHGISQAKILEWVVNSFSRGSSWPKDWTHVSCIGRQILYCWAVEEAHFQTYFILLCFGDITFFINWRLVGTLLWANLLPFLPKAFAHVMPLCHILLILTVF